KVYRTHLLRRSYRDNGKVKNETLGNLSHLPSHVIELIRRSLKGEQFVPAAEAFEVVASPHHGHVHAVLLAMRRLGFDKLISSRPCAERDRVVAMVAARIVEPHSKLATTRWWRNTTLPDTLHIADALESDLYAAMDWLLERQPHIEKKLAKRHLRDGALVLYDLTSSYFEGVTCPLAALGYNRDRKKGKLQVNYGLIVDARGRPIATSVFKGNCGDPKTFLPQVQKVREQFGLHRLVMVGDRGMISQKQIDAMSGIDELDWITALKTGAIRALLEGGQLQLGLFDERNLFEFTDPDRPGERLVACRNSELGRLRAHKRASLLDATSKLLDKVSGMVERGRLVGRDAIGLRVGKVINKHKVGKHFVLDIGERHFRFHLDEQKVAAEAALDGIYVVRTSVPAERLSADDTVRGYKQLANAERAFRSLKTVDLKVRPIHHRLEDRVRAHIFLCMLAYYVEWHMREAWRPLTFADEDQAAKLTRDPVAPARRSDEALAKAKTKLLDDGTEVHSFQTLLDLLATIVRNVCRVPGSDTTFDVVTTPDAKQQRALDLLDSIQL
ncbi:MAG: IS1634 family transposase, partial [Deltaproteobacteria bacterium]|nr:IS1634 family transposase [Deltaproteobacteria bacterium]